ncbi:hypothetical protein P9112_007817 [Eukaryota sp. TZLM1-RC]
MTKLQNRQVTSLNIFNAPEVVTDQKYGFEADVFALGILMYEAFTNNKAYNDDRSLQLKAVLSKERLNVNPALPAIVYNLITDCLQHDPKKRPTLEAVIETLGPIEEQLDELTDRVQLASMKHNDVVITLTSDDDHVCPDKHNSVHETKHHMLKRVVKLSPHSIFVLVSCLVMFVSLVLPFLVN